MTEELLFLGDFYYDYPDMESDIEEIANRIRERDCKTILNLEGGLGSSEEQKIRKRGPNLKCHDGMLTVLRRLYTEGVCLSNNHMMDFGPQGLENTLQQLDAEGIAHTGAGRNLEEAVTPFFVTVGDLSVAILNFGWDVEETVYSDETTPGCSPRKKEVILESVVSAKEQSDKVVVCMHWGFEYNRLPMPYDIDLAHSMIDKGADLIIGHHPHNIQPMEVYKGKRIYYSLGNFYFSSRRKRFTRVFKEAVTNQCDYGLLVYWDPEQDSFSEQLILYDHKTDSSSLQKLRKGILEDISGIDYMGNAYRNEAKRRKLKINPVLGTDEKENKRLLDILFFRYRVRRLIKKIIRK
ncbi:MAG: CapA family protein [Lachnospiraceae bacterium]|nr:CapA family protein [Lachnospiraceae bacterium]